MILGIYRGSDEWLDISSCHVYWAIIRGFILSTCAVNIKLRIKWDCVCIKCLGSPENKKVNRVKSKNIK